MPQGLQIFGPDGTLMIDTNDSLTRFLKRIVIPTTNGSTVVPGLDTGRPFYVLMSTEDSAYSIYPRYMPKITISGTTVSWEWDGTITYSERTEHDLAIGVF